MFLKLVTYVDSKLLVYAEEFFKRAKYLGLLTLTYTLAFLALGIYRIPPQHYVVRNLPKITNKLYFVDPSLGHPILHLRDESHRFFCTAFVVDDKYAITAGHCLEGRASRKIHIYDKDNNDTKLVASVAGYNMRRDYGMILGDFSKFNKVHVEVNQPVGVYIPKLAACGYPSGQKELVCSPFFNQGPNDFFIAGKMAAVYPGMSGGPVIDMNTGVVVAIVVAVSEGNAFISPLVGIYGDLDIEPQAG